MFQACRSETTTKIFPSAARMRKAQEFSSLFALSPVRRSPHFSMYLCKNDFLHARLGLVVSKRLCQRAVERNLIKRIARDLFRHKASTLGSVDVLLRLRKGFPRLQFSSRSLIRRHCRDELTLLSNFAHTRIS